MDIISSTTVDTGLSCAGPSPALDLSSIEGEICDDGDGDGFNGPNAICSTDWVDYDNTDPNVKVRPMTENGLNFSLALRTDGTVWAWGENDSGQLGLGIGSTPRMNEPVQVPGLADIVHLAAGESHSLAVTRDGNVWAWGKGGGGSLGNGFIGTQWSPALVAGPEGSGTTMDNVLNVAAGSGLSVALKNDNTVWAWGHGSFGQMGNDTDTATNYFPVQVLDETGNNPLEDITAVAAGWAHVLAIRVVGANQSEVLAWGLGTTGQLGDNTNVSKKLPVLVQNMTGVVAVAASDDLYAHSLALKDNDEVWAWGQNFYGQLGNESFTESWIPVPVSGLSGVVAIAAGTYHSLALKDNGEVLAWGDNTAGQLGNGTNILSWRPTDVKELAGTAESVSGGGLSSMAVLSDGTVQGWGGNSSGQIGDGTGGYYDEPMQVQGLSYPKSAEALGAGYYHSLAVMPLSYQRKVHAWGSNSVGQLGNGGGPVVGLDWVDNLQDVIQVTGGSGHSVALRKGYMEPGEVWAWGWNNYGQLGINSTTGQSTPVKVDALSDKDIVYVASGASHSLALDADGLVWGWGANFYGQTGTTNMGSYNLTPVLIDTTGISGIIAVEAGEGHSLALTDTGELWAWGYNAMGQLGHNDQLYANSSTPIKVEFDEANVVIVAMDGGVDFTIAIDSEGNVWTWGAGGNGQLGNGTTPYKTDNPQKITGLIVKTDGDYSIGKGYVTAGGNHVLVVLPDNTVKAWGRNDFGQLGNGSRDNSSSPVTVNGLSFVKRVEAGLMFSMAQLSYNHSVLAWGDNAFAQMGIPASADRLEPGQMPLMKNITSIATQTNHSLAIEDTGMVWAWGLNDFGQLGDGTDLQRGYPAYVLDPQDSSGFLTGVSKVATGVNFSVALKPSYGGMTGTVWTWGYNSAGQLGNGTWQPSYEPVPVLKSTNPNDLLTDIVDIKAGNYHVLALDSSGNVWAWGHNMFGQLGLHSTTNKNIATQIAELSEIDMIAAGTIHSLALDITATNSDIWAWGAGTGGQLGDGYSTSYDAPTKTVSQIPNIISIEAGGNYSMAVTDNGTLWAWGYNGYGQLTAYITDPSVPNDISPYILNVFDVFKGQNHILAITQSGAWSCGYNAYGQLGNGNKTYSQSTPQQIDAETWTVLSGGMDHSIGLKNSFVYSWGNDFLGQLGSGLANTKLLPVTSLIDLEP